MARSTVVPAVLAASVALALGSAAPAAAQQGQETPPIVRVTASGTVETTPDRAQLILAVETRADSAREAAGANAERTDSVLQALGRLGISGEAVRTTGYRLEPVYARPDRPRPEEIREPRIVGYRAINTVQVTVDSLPQVGTVIDRGIAAGANRVAGLVFDLRDPEGPRQEAVRRAVRTARARAEAAAEAAGRRLGPVVELHLEDRGVIPLHGRAFDVAAEMAVETPVEPGVLTLSETVTVVWRLEED